MTNKNLSQEICEICGIQAKQFTKDFKTREKAASFGRKITGIPKFMGNKFDIGSYADNKSIYQVHWKEFPDFRLPENFVKLLNTNTDYITKNNKQILCKSIWWHINSDAKRFGKIAPYGIDAFLIILILILKNKNNLYNQSEIDKIKQAIREQEWKYE